MSGKLRDNKVFMLALLLTAGFYLAVVIASLLPSEVIHMTDEFKSEMYIRMSSSINKQTLEIIANNLLVGAGIYLSSVVVFSLDRNNGISESDSNKLKTLIILFNLSFLIAQGFRVGISINKYVYNSYWFSFITLVLPHGITEMAGFALVASSSYYYKTNYLSRDEFYKLALLAVVTIVFSGLLETTLTPFIFRTLLINS